MERGEGGLGGSLTRVARRPGREADQKPRLREGAERTRQLCGEHSQQKAQHREEGGPHAPRKSEAKRQRRVGVGSVGG